MTKRPSPRQRKEMIDPKNITKYNRTERELEIFWLFCLATAGKNADNAARAVAKIVRAIRPEYNSPFEQFAYEPHTVHNILVTSAVGQYTRMEYAIQDTTGLLFSAAQVMMDGFGAVGTSVKRVAHLYELSVEQLEEIRGVGPKTARLFVLHSRRDAKCVPLDTHILAWLRQMGVRAPSSTPHNQKTYKALETTAIGFMNSYFPELSLADADLLVWQIMSGRINMPEELPPVDMSKIHKVLGSK